MLKTRNPLNEKNGNFSVSNHFNQGLTLALAKREKKYTDKPEKQKLVDVISQPGTYATAKRLYREYVRKYNKLIITNIFLLLIIAATTSVQPLLLQQAFDKIFREKDLTYLAYLPVVIIALFIMQALTTYYSTILMNRFGTNLIADMRLHLYEHIINNEIEFYDAHNAGNLMSRVAGEIISISNGIQRFFNAWARQLVTSIGLFAVMLYQSVELTIIAVAAFTIATYPLVKIIRRLRKLMHQVNDQNILFSSRLLESFEGIRVIKAFAKERYEVDKISEYIRNVRNINNKMVTVATITPTLMQCLAGFAVAFVIWYGGYQLIHGHMTEGNLIAFITSLMMISRPVRSLTSSGTTMSAAFVNAERFYKLMDTKPRQATRETGSKLLVKEGAISFQDVHFEYPNGTEALRGVSFTMEAGKKTALVGYSGSGKSTVFNLLLKFYVPKSGNITIDEQPIADASIESLRNSIALVSQDIFIFDDTVKNNIGYGRDGATEEEIINAAKLAKCHDFIMAMPDGYRTKLGFFGHNLSGGQKQRIAIARAFLRDSPILLLDEATSSLDPKTEHEIQESLEKLTKNRTTVIIAHRLSTVMKADKMIMLDNGVVKAVGKHDELMKDSFAYRDLFGI